MPEDFRPWRILSLGDQSYHYKTIQEWLRGGTQIQNVDVCNSTSILASMTMAGLGISVLPPSCYRNDLKNHRLRQLNTEPKVPRAKFWAVYLRSRVSPIIARLASIAQDTSSFS